MIYQPEGFAYEIHYTCTGILPVIILAVSIFACPGSFRSRLSGSVLGAVVLLMVNQLRLVCLFYAGVYMARGTFDFAHSVLGNCLMALATLAMWWVLTRRKNTASTRSESVGCLLEKRAAD